MRSVFQYGYPGLESRQRVTLCGEPPRVRCDLGREATAGGPTVLAPREEGLFSIKPNSPAPAVAWTLIELSAADGFVF